MGEIAILRRMKHDNICPLLGVFASDDEFRKHGLVMEWMQHGNVLFYFESNGWSERLAIQFVGAASSVMPRCFPLNCRRFWISSAGLRTCRAQWLPMATYTWLVVSLFDHVSLMTFLRRQGNVLVDNQLRARLVDFGLSNFVDTNEGSCSSAVSGAKRCAAPEIFKPELINRASPRHTPASDMYSFGQVAWHVSQKAAP